MTRAGEGAGHGARTIAARWTGHAAGRDPAEAERAQGDYLEAEVVDNGVLLKRVSSVEQAWQRIAEAPGSVRYIGPEPRPTPEDEEEWLAEEVKAARREEHAKRRR